VGDDRGRAYNLARLKRDRPDLAVPVIVRAIDNPLEAERVLIESNRQREKTMSERMHEAENIERIVAEENRRKMLAGVTPDGAGGRGHTLNPRPMLDEGLAPQRRTDAAVAEAVGMKRSTHRKVKDVYNTAKDDTLPAPIRAVAQEQMAALDTGQTTPNAAEQAVREAKRRAQAATEQATADGIMAHINRDGPTSAADAPIRRGRLPVPWRVVPGRSGPLRRPVAHVRSSVA